MGWASGSDLAEGVWLFIRKYIPKEERPQVAKGIIEKFRDHDWDTVDEAETLATDAKWYNEKEYDAICAATSSVTGDPGDNLNNDTEYLDDENPTPR
jgi:hypothetical protein